MACASSFAALDFHGSTAEQAVQTARQRCHEPSDNCEFSRFKDGKNTIGDGSTPSPTEFSIGGTIGPERVSSVFSS